MQRQMDKYIIMLVNKLQNKIKYYSEYKIYYDGEWEVYYNKRDVLNRLVEIEKEG